MALTNDDLPVLNEVIRSGDESIIESARLSRVGISELDAASTAPLHFELPPLPHFEYMSEDAEPFNPLYAFNDAFDTSSKNVPTAHVSVHKKSPSPSDILLREAKLEALVEHTVSKHMKAMRHELKFLLSKIHNLP